MCPKNIYLSQLDQNHFGVATARAVDVKEHMVPEIVNYCRNKHVELLITRVLTTEIKTVQSLEDTGCLLMDTLIYYTYDLKKPIPLVETEGIVVRPVKSGEEEQVKNIATSAFTGYIGHYQADSRLDHGKCDELYPMWAYHSCEKRESSQEVFVAAINNRLIGFLTISQTSEEEGEIGLYCVDSEYRGGGVAQQLMIKGMNWCVASGIKRTAISTQITNIASQKVWVRMGFEPTHSYYTFHKWLK